MNVERFPRANRDDPSRSGECTDIPGFYGRPVGILRAPKAVSPLRAAIQFVAFLACLYFVASFFV